MGPRVTSLDEVIKVRSWGHRNHVFFKNNARVGKVIKIKKTHTNLFSSASIHWIIWDRHAALGRLKTLEKVWKELHRTWTTVSPKKGPIFKWKVGLLSTLLQGQAVSFREVWFRFQGIQWIQRLQTHPSWCRAEEIVCSSRWDKRPTLRVGSKK